MGKLGSKLLRNMFSLDWRSLALLRMGLAVVVLCDLFVCGRSVGAFYTDDGVLPRDWVDVPANPLMGLHLAGDGVWYEGGLLALEAASALLLLLGWRTRYVTVLSWVLLLSRQARNPLLLFGPDIVLRLGLFWGMFLPLGRRFSLDAAAGRERPPAEPDYFGVAGFCFIFQFLLIYFTNSAVKSGPSWQVSHTAVYEALALEMYARPLGQWFNQFDTLNRWITVVVPRLELYGPLLFILPWWTGRARLLGFTIFFVLQLGFNLTMTLGLFGPVMIAVMLALLPTEFWTGIAEPAGCRLARSLPFLRPRPAGPTPPPPGSRVAGQPRWWNGSRWWQPLRWLRDGPLLFLALYAAAWDHDTLPGRRPLLPQTWRWIAWDLGLDQQFDMFGTDPQTDDGWFVLCGTLKNGRTVNAFTGVSPADFSHPASVPETYRDQRWAAWLVQLWYPEAATYLEPFALYLGRDWNRTHAGGEEMATLQVIFRWEGTGPNHTRQPLERVILWTESLP